MKLMSADELRSKTKAALLHLLLSGLLAGIVAYVVFTVWFPYPYSQLSGGRNLFLLMIAVDICCGPLLTFVLFSATKPRKELMCDLGLVVFIQLAALCYGVYSVMLARPAYVVFEGEIFRVVTAVDVATEELPLAKPEFQKLNLSGPTFIAFQSPDVNDKDYAQAMNINEQSIDIIFRPKYWVPYASKTADILSRAKPVTDLQRKHPDKAALIAAAVKETTLAEGNLLYLPMRSRTSYDWSVLLEAKTAKVVGYVHADGF